MNSTEIKASKTKQIKITIGSIVFIAVGIYFIVDENSVQLEFLGFDINRKMLGYVVVSFFGLCAVLIIKRLFSKTAGLIIDESGITDNSSYTAVGFISWRDIEEVSTINLKGQDLVLIKVNNPNDYLNNTPSGIKRKILQLNINSTGTPIAISSTALQCEHNELLNSIHQYFEMYHNKK